MSAVVISREELLAFHERVMRCRDWLEGRPYGTQAQLAYDCRVNASRVSNTLRCRTIDYECLDKIEAWIRVQPPVVPVEELMVASVG